MFEYHIEGGTPIEGVIKASGNKNAALPCIAAAVLTSEAVVLRNIPDIEDVGVMLDVFKSFGGVVEKIDANAYRLRLEKSNCCEVPDEFAKKIRASILFAGPLLARCGVATLSPPGGDVIGRRRLDTHFLALTELGASVSTENKFSFKADKLHGKDIFLDEASVTATENAIMAAVLAEGVTILTNVASEPHVQDLCNLLNLMGAKITGIGSNILTISGVDVLHGADFSIGPDYMEIGSYIGLAVATHGSIKITNINPKDMRPLKQGFAKLGITWEIKDNTLSISKNQTLTVNKDFGGMIPKIDDAPWPGFPADLTSIMVVIATQVTGTVLIHEKMFESRMFFVDKLISMGAMITLCDPHRVVVTGPSLLQGSELVSPDVRAGMAILIAACCAKGKSVIKNIYQIDRGYEDLEGRLKSLGVKIKRKEVSTQ
ncbi:MAG: UDP-N-acetylglucosamine 1-carboxyvinyltransferase [Treponema sp.]|nr:MAG: UDP-N-acetylglucosamine 1-carboxyvinyltransferase [Treponema sp.]